MLPIGASVDQGAMAKKGVLYISQSSSFTVDSPSDCFVPYQGHSLGESHPTGEMQSVYSKSPANWAEIVYCPIQDTHWGSFTSMQRCSRCILQPQLTGLSWWDNLWQPGTLFFCYKLILKVVLHYSQTASAALPKRVYCLVPEEKCQWNLSSFKTTLLEACFPQSVPP